jgi:hypothetical protein
VRSGKGIVIGAAVVAAKLFIFLGQSDANGFWGGLAVGLSLNLADTHIKQPISKR